MNHHEYERFAPSLLVVHVDLVDIFIQVEPDCEPDGKWNFVQDCEQAGIIGRLCDVEGPADESDSNGNWLPARNVEPFSDFLDFFSQALGGIET
jgi:hypothetical protein